MKGLMRTLTPLGWLALVGAAVLLLAVVGRGLGSGLIWPSNRRWRR